VKFRLMTTRFALLALMLAVPTGGAGAGALPPPGVAACSGCHLASGGDPRLPRLSGRTANEIVAVMKAFRNGTRPATVMDRIAKGFSDDEIAVIAAWYATQ
jgi:cytochrome subunit of sulfide dehydrogenase